MASVRNRKVDKSIGRVQNSQIKTKARVRDHGEVYTNEREVKSMCDLIPKEIWKDIDSTFLEPACGNGNFIFEILKRKLKLCQTEDEVYRAYNSIWGIDILQDNCEETKNRMKELCPKYADKNKLPLNIICGNSLEIMKEWEIKNESSKSM